MVNRQQPPKPDVDGDSGDDFYDELQEQWPAERPSRKRRRTTAKRAYHRKDGRHVVVRGERLDPPDTVRLSRALLAAQRELAQAQAEAEARAARREEA